MIAPLTIHFEEDELQDIAVIAERRGYTSITGYVQDLINADAMQHDEAAPFDINDSNEMILQSIKEGLQQALRGEGSPIEELWAALDED